MTDIILHHHTGLGDHICLYGLVKYLVTNKYENIYLVCKDNYTDSIAHLYKNDDSVHLISMPNPGNDITKEILYVNYFSETKKIPVIRIGFEHLTLPFHYSKFFNQLDIPYSCSWSLFPDFESTEQSKQLYKSLDLRGKNYALVINENSYGKNNLKITEGLSEYTQEIYRTDLGTGVFDWLDVIRNASVIHSVGTGIFHLIDRMKDLNINGKYYFHNVRDDYKTIDTRLNWNLVDYE